MEELQPVHFPLHPARRILNDTEQLKYSMLKYSSLQTGIVDGADNPLTGVDLIWPETEMPE